MTRYKKVLLVKPPEHSFFNFGVFSLGVLAAAVDDIADISIIDATHFTLDETVKYIFDQKPDLVGITLMGFTSVPTGAELVKALKHRNFTVIAGGHGAALIPEPLIEAGVDAVVFGEGEATFRDILEKGIHAGMPGTILPDPQAKDSVKMIKGPLRELINPLDLLKPPLRHMMPPPENNIHLMETSRGCPHHCKFCETTRFFGHRWRPYSAERVTSEVKRLIDDYDGWLIHFADDNFAASTKRVKEICNLLIKEEALPAYFMFSARADDLVKDPELIPMMAEARMLRITVGIDTLDAEVGQKVDKTITPETFHHAFQEMRKHGIFSIASIIVGLPDETEESRAKTIERAVEVGPDSAQFLPYLPFPGLPRKKEHVGWDSLEEDVREASRLTREYFSVPSVRQNLMNLAQGDGIQAQLARGTIKKIKRREAINSTLI